MGLQVARRVRNPLPYQGKLTVANLITDVTRLAGVGGDGAAYPDSSAGVWPAATNYILNSNCATNANNIDSNASATVSRATDRYKFGGASLKVLCPGLGGSEGANYRTAVGTAAPSDIRSAEIWVYHEASGSLNFYVQIAWRDSGGSALSPTSGSSTAVAPFTWTRLTVTGTAPASTDRADVKAIKSSTSTDTFWVGGVQLETGSIATPYIHTDGGTASRSAGRIQMPASVLDETQMWLTMRVRAGSAYNVGSGVLRLFQWQDSVTERLILQYVVGDKFYLDRDSGAGGSSASAALNFAAGDSYTVTGAFEAEASKISVNGASFSSVANSAIPTLAASAADIGSISGTSGHLNGNALWVALGRGTLTDADAALLHAFGNNRPLPHQFPKSADLRFLAHFYGDGTAYRYRAA